GHPGETDAHASDFFGNDRIGATSTVGSLENATVTISTTTEGPPPSYTGTFNISNTPHTFTAGQWVRVEGVKDAGGGATGWDGLWQVAASPAPSHTKFLVAHVTPNLPNGHDGTAGDGRTSDYWNGGPVGLS